MLNFLSCNNNIILGINTGHVITKISFIHAKVKLKNDFKSMYIQVKDHSIVIPITQSQVNTSQPQIENKLTFQWYPFEDRHLQFKESFNYMSHGNELVLKRI